MSIFLGTSERKNIYLGSTKIQKVYLGTTQMYTSVEANLASTALFSGDSVRNDLGVHSITFLPNGTITSSATLVGNTSVWTNPSPEEGAGNQFWIKVVGTKVDNSPPFDFDGVFNEWLSLSTAQSFGIEKSNTQIGGISALFDIQLATDSFGLNVVDTGQFTLNMNFYTERESGTIFLTNFIP